MKFLGGKNYSLDDADPTLRKTQPHHPNSTLNFIFLPPFFCRKDMPISSPVVIRPVPQSEFAALDYEVMRHAFSSQNALGRLCDEAIYQNDLAARLEEAGLGPVRTQVPVTLSHCDFGKTYWLDLVVGDAAIYELKTELRLASQHDAQLLNYMFLCEAHHGKLVNFRPAQVESKFLNSTLTPQSRRELNVREGRWREIDERSEVLRARLLDVLQDWGGFLELSFYLEALTHFLGGREKVECMLPLKRSKVLLGNQRFHLISPETALRLTAITGGAEDYERQLKALLFHSPLKAIQWINLAGHQVELITLAR